MSAAVSSSLTMIINFWQNINLNLNIPYFQAPEWLKSVLNCFNDLFFFLAVLFEKIPKFDIRAQLVLLSIGMPLILDVITWFASSLRENIFHIVDIAAFGIFTYFLANGIAGSFELLNIFACIALSIVIAVRLYFIIKSLSAEKNAYEEFEIEICRRYLYGIVPIEKPKKTIREMNRTLLKICPNIQLLPSSLRIADSISSLLLGVLMLAICLWCFGVFSIFNIYPSPTLSFILPLIAFPIAFISIIKGFLQLFKCGRQFIFDLTMFCKRWGLRLLMLLIDALFIPILTIFLKQLMTDNLGCGKGEYLKIEHYHNENLDPYVTHDYKCTPCATDINSSLCLKKCDDLYEYRIIDDNGLKFMDVLSSNGGVLLYTIAYVLIGIPLLWYYLVQKNKNLVLQINAYGSTPDEKWKNLLARLKTTGIFLFTCYNYRNDFWSVLLFFYKLLVLITTLVSEHVSEYIMYILPVIYIAMFILEVVRRPSIRTANTVIDSLYYVINIAFSFVPILIFNGVSVPTLVTDILSVLAVVLPVVSLIYIFISICRYGDSNDITSMPEFTDEELEKRARKRKRLKMLDRLRREEEEDGEEEEEEEEKSENESSDEDGEPKEEESEVVVNTPIVENNQVPVQEEEYAKPTKNVCVHPPEEQAPQQRRPRITRRKIEKVQEASSGQKEEHQTTKNVDYRPNKQISARRYQSSDDSSLDSDILDSIPVIINYDKFPIKSTVEEPRRRRCRIKEFSSEADDERTYVNVRHRRRRKRVHRSYHNEQPKEEPEFIEEPPIEGVFPANYNEEIENQAQIQENQKVKSNNKTKKEKENQEPVKKEKTNKENEKPKKQEKKAKTQESKKNGNNKGNGETPSNNFDIIKFKDVYRGRELPEDIITLTENEISSISRSTTKENKSNKTFKVNRLKIADRMDQMYEMLDIIIDGSTITMLSNVLKIVIVCGSVACGWYLGVTSCDSNDKFIDCTTN